MLFMLWKANEKINSLDAKYLDLLPGDYVLLRITDTGCGMDNFTKEKIFDPFFSTKGERGTGLGLSQVYNFVRNCSGTIKVNSELGYGSSFDIYFPKKCETITDVSPAVDNAGEDKTKSKTVLVVDDQQAIVELTRDILITKGYRVLTANDANEALSILEKETVELLITDVVMPNMNGYQLACQVRTRFPKTKIQIMSGFDDEQYHDTSDDILHQNILKKPFTSKMLISSVQNLLDDIHSEKVCEVLFCFLFYCEFLR